MSSHDKGRCIVLTVMPNFSDDVAGLIFVRRTTLSGRIAGLLKYYSFIPWQGRGLMSSGLGLLTETASVLLEVDLLVARVDPKNHHSERLLQATGFRYVGRKPPLLNGYGPEYANVWCFELRDCPLHKLHT